MAWPAESISEEENLGVFVDKNLITIQQYVFVAKQANDIIECINKSEASRSNNVLVPLYT